MHAGTFNGGGISVAAANATLDALLADGGAAYEHMRALGPRCMRRPRRARRRGGQHARRAGPGPGLLHLVARRGPRRDLPRPSGADRPRYARFAELLAREGVRVIPAGRWYLTAAHGDDDVDRTLAAVERALAALAA